jgi:hypothetical protein
VKRNINARAIASLELRVSKVRMDDSELIRDMEQSIAEANSFIGSMTAP